MGPSSNRPIPSVLPQIKKLGEAALDFLFPKTCVGCGKVGDFICPQCRAKLRRIHPPVCPKCGRPQASGVMCPGCISWDSQIDGIRSPYRFEGAMREAIHQFKYKNVRALAPVLGKMLWDYAGKTQLPGEVIVPVPLHPKRLRERGYNQSALLAREMGRLSFLPVVDNRLLRLRHTPPQALTHSVEERRRNMWGAFACPEKSFEGIRVLLVDDVSTSATTLDAAAAALKQAGAISVWGLVLAREI